ncbi:DUF3592 domain-containing protein [Halohasta litorea]|uniref:DUF3592 domain-containing protein n=1 Tax=Halohasta litorea TaxID=869891 RepID=A0ABD6D7S3_9EURY|nr:DUF3592 domain-containing protein [Halohasta litorea]MEA1931733.1 DUF3592 domain-containing protein [Euryarchaeota archaeon]
MRLSIDSERLSPVHVGVLLLLGGVVMTGYGLYDYTQQSSAVSNAVEVDATVTDTDIDTISQRRGSSDYQPVVAFEYRFEGTDYTSDSLYPSSVEPDYDTESAARDEIESYAAGDSVTAYVDPASPGEAFLRNEESNSPLKFAAIGGVMVILSGRSILKHL